MMIYCDQNKTFIQSIKDCLRLNPLQLFSNWLVSHPPCYWSLCYGHHHSKLNQAWNFRNDSVLFLMIHISATKTRSKNHPKFTNNMCKVAAYYECFACHKSPWKIFNFLPREQQRNTFWTKKKQDKKIRKSDPNQRGLLWKHWHILALK